MGKQVAYTLSARYCDRVVNFLFVIKELPFHAVLNTFVVRPNCFDSDEEVNQKVQIT